MCAILENNILLPVNHAVHILCMCRKGEEPYEEFRNRENGDKAAGAAPFCDRGCRRHVQKLGKRSTKKILEGWIASYESKDFYTWAIAWREDEGNVIGSIAVPQLNQKAGRVTVGYCLGRKWWGNGIMKEAFAELIRFFFEVEGANRVEALHDTRNVNSGKVMMACGLKKEGTLRQYGWNNQGICDECIYGMVASDYFEGK